MMAAVYQHPDGHEIAVGNGLITACTSEGTAVSLPIGPDGMAALGAALIERSIAEKHGDASERAAHGKLHALDKLEAAK